MANKKKDDPKGEGDNSGAEKETPDLSGTAQTPMPDPDQDPDDENDPDFDNAEKFEKYINEKGNFSNSGERHAFIKNRLSKITKRNGWVKNKRLSKMNGRDVYRDPKTGKYYSVDTRHGRFQVSNKQGKDQGKMDISGKKIEGTKDSSGKHDLKVK